MINQLLNHATVLFIIKILFLIADSFYIIFLIIVLNRIISMGHIVKDAHDQMIIHSIAIFKVLVAVSLFLLALAIL